jgi:hypothetical protein
VKGPAYHFSRFGVYLGHIDAVGRYFEKGGTYRGVVGEDGILRDATGVCRGRFDVQGSFWDEQGTYGGYLSQPDGGPLRLCV